MVFVSCMAQFRLVADQIPVEMRCYGVICRHFEAHIGYTIYEIEQACAVSGYMSIVTTFYLKYEAVRSLNLKSKRIKLNIFLIHVPALTSYVTEALTVYTVAMPEETRKYYLEVNKDNTVYAVFGGSLKNIASQLNLLILSFVVCFVPFIGLWLRKQTLDRINTQLNNSSTLNKNHTKMFVKGLTIQVLLPLICYVPIFLVYYYCLATHYEILFQQYFITLIPAFPALVDPCVALYFVAPYRKKIKTWLRMEKSSTVAAPVRNVSI